MPRGERFPDDQAEVVFCDAFVQQLGELPESEREHVLGDVVRLCDEPAGKHPLAAPLNGWNTLEALNGHKRVVYKATVSAGTALVDAGLLELDEITDLWDALAVLEVVAEAVGLDGWDFQPPPAPEGMVRAVVAAGLMPQSIAALLSKHELEAAMAGGWGAGGPDPRAALVAALEAARYRDRLRRVLDVREIVASRMASRCGVVMPRAGARCIRRAGHPGPHRAR